MTNPPGSGYDDGDRNRVPARQTDGGRFTARTHPEADVSLPEDVDGSFWFPPETRTVEDIIDFWSQVPIPDVALRRAEGAQMAAHDEYTEEAARASWAEDEERWLAAHPKPEAKKRGKNPELEQWKADYEEHKAACMKQYSELVLEEHPRSLPWHDIRPIVRAAAMRIRAQHDDVMLAAILDHEIELADRTMTVGEITDVYKLGHKANSFMAMRTEDDPSRAATTMPPGELRKKLEGIEDQIEDVGKFLAEVQRIEGMSGSKAGRKQLKRDYG